MAEHFRFFNAVEQEDPVTHEITYDREYRADEFAEYFGLFLSDGLFSVDGKAGLKVLVNEGMEVSVDIGYAFIKGYMYKNDSLLPITIDTADQNLDRIDRVVIRFDEVAREIRTKIKKGTPSSSPQPPELESTDAVKELSLAQVKIKKGITSISSADITDERLTSTCGLVNSLITVPVDEIWAVWNDTVTAIEEAWTSKEIDIQNEWTSIKNSWNEWFVGRQNDLGVRITTGVLEPSNLVSGDIWLRELA